MKNSKLIKGIIAGGLGTVLLMGGGTFAIWRASVGTSVAAIQTGQLNLTWTTSADAHATNTKTSWKVYPDDISTWPSNTPTTTGVVYDVANTSGTNELYQDNAGTPSTNPYLMVPGDTAQLAGTLKIIATGDNLNATLSGSMANIVTGVSGDDTHATIVNSLTSSDKTKLSVLQVYTIKSDGTQVPITQGTTGGDWATKIGNSLATPVTIDGVSEGQPVYIDVLLSVHFPAAPLFDNGSTWEFGTVAAAGNHAGSPTGYLAQNSESSVPTDANNVVWWGTAAQDATITLTNAAFTLKQNL